MNSITNITFSEDFLLIVMMIQLGLIVILFVFLIRSYFKTKKLTERIDDFCRGADGTSLEEDMGDMFEENESIRNHLSIVDEKIDNLYWRMKSPIQKVGVVKYDAFSQMGGMLSYAIALLDENNDGVILNCVHSVDSCYTYTKIVQKGRADVDLGAEESRALKMAIDRFNPDGPIR